MLTLELAVMLPAAALVYVNYHHLKSIERDKVLEAAIHRDFQQMLAISEKKINQRAYAITKEVIAQFPCPDTDSEADKEKKLGLILAANPWLSHVFLYDDQRRFVFHSQPQQLRDPELREEGARQAKMYGGWLGLEGKGMVKKMHEENRPISCYGHEVDRAGGKTYTATAFFCFPQLPEHRGAMGGAIFNPDYLKQSFFPELLEELVSQKLNDEGGNRLAMIVYPIEGGSGPGNRTLATSAGWKEGKPEVSRNLSEVFSGLALGIKYQDTTVEALGQSWVQGSYLILGVLTVLLVGGLMLTYRSVNKEMALARLKSDFVSNVSHELRTPLSLIRLYAETLELGRIRTQEKAEEYYRIIRKESERLTALINNILDFSRIEAGRKEYDFRETDLAELVRNTLDAYRYQIEQQGFTFEQRIDSNLPAMRVDREAIARSLVNLVNNALKYSADEKFLCVRLYRVDDKLRLEVVDRGIGIARGEHSKIFEKFYRTGDPLVHNTRGSGLGLSLVRHIAHAHGGEVEVESTPGKGSKFTLLLPLPGASPGLASAAPSEVAMS
ncbi:MAG: HAMP domain-containing histidine kinase [Acidobacteria bacterium]|nr:HAMP domain-containing histidine kinase [Acidobacteriota bacterium]